MVVVLIKNESPDFTMRNLEHRWCTEGVLCPHAPLRVFSKRKKSGLSFCHNTTPLIFLLRTWQADAEESFHALAQIKWNEWVNITLSGNGFVKYDAGDGQ